MEVLIVFIFCCGLGLWLDLNLDVICSFVLILVFFFLIIDFLRLSCCIYNFFLILERDFILFKVLCLFLRFVRENL